ncbi:cell division protein FtsI (penicillin-binding protein 3) [Paucidesulfovibrio gracilis DSM 16080]|uniref:Cell division protein FtsI (Penicillin-binding protein 3) n=1 Tax=Paucidesulfovibrio gracilis DSM 16080 TaxID=1121449 RepID=A0A1T4W530_9BACT|nr:penicillin-binding transpeptidase domain-containing protein [Paucidesulfovibrio gracilis]SKA72366.1 cell division protein FtsI (penicillin-binding protein 3) [Paucidesulfovibrio gracilis DSM 16080]
MRAKREHKRPGPSGSRLILAGILFALVWAGLWVRAGWIQLYRGPKLEQLAAKQTLSTEFERGRRGRILARDGDLLATSVEAKSAYLRPVEVSDRGTTAKALHDILGVSEQGLKAHLASRKNFIWIKRQITDREAVALTKADLDGVYLTSEYVRLYPQGRLAGQLLGFVNIDGKGMEGLERAFEPRLAGGKAEQVKLRDASGRRLYLDAQGREVDIDGQDLRLTIDTHIQDVTEQALADAVTRFKAKSGTTVVVRVPTGEILAMASYPFFNPNAYRRSTADIRRNRAAMDAVEPGSTMKPLLFAAALEEGVITPDKLIDCEEGRYKVGPNWIRDHHNYKWMSVNKVLRYSSNIGAAKIGEALGAQHYFDYLRHYGFGERSRLALPAESPGILRPVREWNEFDLAAASFGQGISVTALQMAQAFLPIACQGVRQPLRLVLLPKQDADFGPQDRMFSPSTAKQVLSMMTEVVQEDGTGRFARIPGVTMAGKTGTAQKATTTGGYGDKYLSSFVGLVPGDDPELLVVTMVDEPETTNAGGKVAAPVVKEVAMRTLAYYGRLPDPSSPAFEVVPDGEAVAEAAMAQQNTGPPEAPKPVSGSSFEGGTTPDVTGMPLRRAMEILARGGVVPVLKGNGMTVTGQRPDPGQPWPETGNQGGQDVFILWLS